MLENGYILTVDMINGFLKEINDCQKKTNPLFVILDFYILNKFIDNPDG